MSLREIREGLESRLSHFTDIMLFYLIFKPSMLTDMCISTDVKGQEREKRSEAFVTEF